MILVAPILLTHEEIKEAQESQLVVHESFSSYTQLQPNTVRGMPTESGANTPLLFLVPHHAMQKYHYSVSLLNIATILNSLLMTAWADREDIRSEVAKVVAKENEAHRRVMLAEDGGSPDSVSPPKSPVKPNTGVRRLGTYTMTFTTISPKN